MYIQATSRDNSSWRQKSKKSWLYILSKVSCSCSCFLKIKIERKGIMFIRFSFSPSYIFSPFFLPPGPCYPHSRSAAILSSTILPDLQFTKLLFITDEMKEKLGRKKNEKEELIIIRACFFECFTILYLIQ